MSEEKIVQKGIVIFEDQPSIVETLTTYLEIFDLEVVASAGSKEEIEKLLIDIAKGGLVPTLITVDHEMKDIDGNTVAKMLRQIREQNQLKFALIGLSSGTHLRTELFDVILDKLGDMKTLTSVIKKYSATPTSNLPSQPD